MVYGKIRGIKKLHFSITALRTAVVDTKTRRIFLGHSGELRKGVGKTLNPLNDNLKNWMNFNSKVKG